MSLAYNYWCRYHGRTESTEDDEACLTAEQVEARSEQWKNRRTDPPCFIARVLGWFGLEVLP